MALNIKKLLVSQPKPASEKSPYFDIAEKYGVEIDFRPFIKVEPLIIQGVQTADKFLFWIIPPLFSRPVRRSIISFTCVRNCVLPFPETMKYFCMTEAIAVYLQKYIVYRKRKIFLWTDR